MEINKEPRRDPRGRPREFAGVVRAPLRADEYAWVMAEMERTDRPMARVVRELVTESIKRRLKQRR